MKNIFKSKQSVLIGLIVLFILMCVVFGVGKKDTSQHTENISDKEKVEITDNINNTNEEDAEDTKINDLETNDVEQNKDNGLSVIETLDGSIDSVDGSGSWDAKDTTKKDITTSENNSDENILVDDKVWGDVN